MRNCLRCFPLFSLFPFWLLALDVAPLSVRAQQPGDPALKIVILEGEGAINNIRQRVSREPIVQIQDENDRPVAGAIVTFLLPDTGPSGAFLDGGRVLVVTTDEAGRAVARGLTANALEGPLNIRVTASHDGLRASTTITQSNSVAGAVAGGGAAAGMSGKTIAVILAVAAGAAVGAAVALGGGGSGNGGPSPTPPIPTTTTISAGGGSIGSPP